MDWRCNMSKNKHLKSVWLLSIIGVGIEYVKEQNPKYVWQRYKKISEQYVLSKNRHLKYVWQLINESAKALQYIEHQTPEMFIAAMKHDSRAVNYISEECAKSLINNVEKRISNRQAVKPRRILCISKFNG